MNKIKNEFQYKIIGIILYLFSSLAGLSILFLCSPRKLLFDENIETENIKLNLYKNFAKNIYDNINTPLIKNITLTKDNENCPKNFEPLILNIYYGKFSKFYGNKSICIERLDGNKYSFINLLKISSYTEINKNKKKCGELFKDSNLYFYTSNENMCPLNNIEINNYSRAKNISPFYYQISPDDQYFTPIYGYNPKYPVITNIEITNNYQICLGRHSRAKNFKESFCEFPDDNKCFIEDNYEQIYTLEHNNNDNFKLSPINLAKWNLANDKNIKHHFCKEDINFNIFVHGYVNFTENNYEQFIEEFPPNDYTNNALYKAYKSFKMLNNIDNVFFLVLYNLFVWSAIHFVFQIMLYLGKKGIRNIYIVNGLILFFFRLISFFGMIINYYCFYLKIEKVYIEMVDEPRNKVLEYYYYTRKNFIIKIIKIFILVFLILCFDLIVLFFTIIIKWGFDFKIKKEEAEKKENAKTKIDKKMDINKNPKIENKLEAKLDIKIDLKAGVETKAETKTKTATKENNIINNNNHNHIILDNVINNSYGEPSFSANSGKINTPVMANGNNQFNNIQLNQFKKIKENSKKINLFFIFKEDISQCYLIQIDENESFLNALNLLRETYPNLKEKNMIVFQCDSNIINREKTVYENGLADNSKIFIISR